MLSIANAQSMSSKNVLKQWALYYESIGMYVLPIREKEKIPYIKWAHRKDRRPTRAEIETWWEKWPSANIGFATGACSGVDVLDFDSEGALETFQQAVLPGVLEAGAPIVQTAQGWHIYYRYNPEHAFRSKAAVGRIEGLDFRSNGGIIVAPPSAHKSGVVYSWAGTAPESFPIMPAVLSNWLESVVESSPGGYFHPVVDREAYDQARAWGFDIEALTRDNGLSVLYAKRITEQAEGEMTGLLFALRECLFSSRHQSGTSTPGEAAFIVGTDGNLRYQCFHASCASMGLLDVNAVLKTPIKNLETLLNERNKRIEQEVIRKFNRRYAVVSWEDHVRVLDTRQRGAYGFLPEKDFKLKTRTEQAFFEKLTPTGKLSRTKNRKYGADVWLDAQGRREFDRVIFEPGAVPQPGELNLWRGFAVEPKEGGDWEIMKEHMFLNLCSGHQDEYEYLYNWLAAVVQHCADSRRNRKPGVVVVLQGGQGTGKDSFFDLVGQMFRAENRMTAHDIERITGRFNMHLKGLVWVHLAEAFWGGNRGANSALKAIINGQDMTIEQKGGATFQISNHMNLVFSSNEAWTVKADSDDRRHFLPSLTSKKPPTAFFKALHRHMRQEAAVSSMLLSLMSHSVPEDFFKAPLQTEKLEDQKTRSMDVLSQFLWDEIEDARGRGVDEVPNSLLPKLSFGASIDRDLFYESYLNFHTKLKDRGRTLTKTQFVREVHKKTNRTMEVRKIRLPGAKTTQRGFVIGSEEEVLENFKKFR